MSDNLFEKLNEALQSGNQEDIDRIKKEILISNRDTKIDENFINSISGKALYKNIRGIINEGEEKSVYDYTKLLSSLITHAVIECEKTGNSFNDYGVNEMYIMLGKFITGDDNAVNETKKFLTSRYSEFILG